MTRYFIGLALIVMVLSLPTSLLAQERQVFKGIVLDSATLGRLPYVNVKIKNTIRGASADARGSFALNASLGDTLVFSMIGYNPLEFPITSWESVLIRLSEKPEILESVTIQDISTEAYFKNLFQNQYRQLEKSRRKAPFYLSKDKKEMRYLAAAEKESEMAKVFIEHVATNEKLKQSLMTKHDLSLNEYYQILQEFNERSYTFMYYLSAPELLSMVRSFFEKRTAQAN